MIKRKILIDGEEVDSESGKTFEVINPATQEPFEEVPECGESEVRRAVESAKRAVKEWAKIPVVKKVELFEKVRAILDERAEKHAQLTTRECGKTVREARVEALFTSGHWKIMAAEMQRLRGKTYPNNYEESNNLRIFTTREPIGVVGVIGPWNWPFDIPTLASAAAIAAGNAVVLKPSSNTPGCGIEIAKVIRDAGGFPKGILNVVTGPGGTVGNALVTHPHVGAIHFTGSTKVGEEVARSCGVKKLILELGDAGPMIVLEDANIDAAIKANMFGTFHQCGENCTSTQRVIIHEKVHDEYVDKLISEVRKIRVGDPLKEETDMGPVISEEQAKNIDFHIKDALDKGAGLLIGGKRENLFYEPTVLDNVTQDMVIAKEEVFGPVVAILKFRNKDEAVEIANSTIYGLQGALFTSNLRDAYIISEKMKFGSVIVNDTTNHWDQLSPFGGVKGSGIGRECGHFGIEEFTDIKRTVINLANVK